MSILIKGMEMPVTCCHCPLMGYDPDREWFDSMARTGAHICVLTGELIDNTKREDHCPLVPVPPHGDLIERNKLYEKTAEWEAQALHMVEVTMHDEDTTEWRKWSTVLTERSAFKFDVADAPTIIPGEEGE